MTSLTHTHTQAQGWGLVISNQNALQLQLCVHMYWFSVRMWVFVQHSRVLSLNDPLYRSEIPPSLSQTLEDNRRCVLKPPQDGND